MADEKKKKESLWTKMAKSGLRGSRAQVSAEQDSKGYSKKKRPKK